MKIATIKSRFQAGNNFASDSRLRLQYFIHHLSYPVYFKSNRFFIYNNFSEAVVNIHLVAYRLINNNVLDIDLFRHGSFDMHIKALTRNIK